MGDIVQQLTEIKEMIESAKTSKAKAEGRLEDLMKRLKKDFGISDIKEAKTLLTKLTRKNETLKEELKEGISALKEQYDI